MAVQIDATTKGAMIHPWLSRWKTTYYETPDHSFRTENGYTIQWKNILRDLKHAFRLPQLLPRLAYSVAVLFIVLYKNLQVPFEALVIGAVAFNDKSSLSEAHGSNDITTFSTTHTAAGDNRIASVACSSYRIGAGDVDTATGTYGGSAMTEVVKHATPSAVEGQLTVFKYIAPPASSQTVEITFSTAVRVAWLAISSFTGADQTTQSGDTDTAASSGADMSATLTTTNGDMIADAGIFGTGGANITVDGTNQVLASKEDQPGWACLATSYIPAVGVSTTTSWNISDSAGSNLAAWVIQQSTGGAAANHWLLMGV